VEKTYVVKTNGALTPEQEEQFRTGVHVHGRKTATAKLKLIRPGAAPWYEVRLIEGRQNQIRIMFRHFGVLVEKLRRVQIAFLKLDVKPGEWRHLTEKEVAKFRRLLNLEQPDEQHG
jgi:23S rRNA pseudouridine2605 synthase